MLFRRPALQTSSSNAIVKGLVAYELLLFSPMMVPKTFKTFLICVASLCGSISYSDDLVLPAPLSKNVINDICGSILSSSQQPLPQAPADMSVERAKRLGDKLIQNIADALLSDSMDFAEETHVLITIRDQMQQVLAFAKNNQKSFEAFFLNELHEYYFILLLELKLREHGRSVTLYADHFLGEHVEFGENPEFDELQGRLLNEARDLKGAAGTWEEPNFLAAAKAVRNFNRKRLFAPFDKSKNNGPKPTATHTHRFAQTKPKTAPVTKESLDLVHSALDRVNWDKWQFQLQSPKHQEIVAEFPGIEEKFTLMKNAAKILQQLPPAAQQPLTGVLYTIAFSHELLKHVRQSQAGQRLYANALMELLVYNLLRYQYELVANLRVAPTNQLMLNFALIHELQSSLFEDEPDFNLQVVVLAERYVGEAFKNEQMREQMRRFVNLLNTSLVGHSH